MIQRFLIAVGLAAMAATGPAAAQGTAALAETYRQLCGTPAAAATESCAELRRAMGTATPTAGGSPARATEPVRVAAGDTFELTPGPLTRSFKTPYGQTTSFEVKVPKGRTVEVEIDAPEGSAQLQVCWIPDEFLGGSGYCYAPGSVDKGRALYRFLAERKGEVKVKASKTKGPTGATYQVTTREEPRGHGTALLARLERLAGRPHLMNTTVEGIPMEVAVDYMVEVPGRSGSMRYRGEDGSISENKLTLDAASGDLMFASASGQGIVYPTADGEISFYVKGGRAGWSINADGSVRRSVDQKVAHFDAAKSDALGGFLRVENVSLKPTTERAIAAIRKAGPKRIELAKAKRLMDWGAYTQLAGRSWLYPNDNGGQNIAEYSWETPGQVLTGKFWSVGWYGAAAPFTTLRLVHDSDTGSISGAFTDDQRRQTPVTVKRGPFGEALSKEGEWNVRLEMASPNDMLMQSSRGSAPLGPAKRYTALDKLQLASFADQGRAAEAQRRAQAQAQANSGGGGGMFAALAAGFGAAMAGGSTEQVLGMAAEGARMADPGGNTAMALGQVAGAVGAPQMDVKSTLMSSVGVGSGGVGAVGGAGGSYPTKPNLAAGLCPGFSEANYRTVALQPGGDVQRKSFCGQSYEFYTMYKRAIAQGYSEADSNRTYAAHEGAVAQLRSFLGQ